MVVYPHFSKMNQSPHFYKMNQLDHFSKMKMNVQVYQQLAILDFCEVEFLLKCLVEEGVLTAIEPSIFSASRLDEDSENKNLVRRESNGVLYFREFFSRVFSLSTNH